MRISDWSSDVCSSDLIAVAAAGGEAEVGGARGDLQREPLPAAGTVGKSGHRDTVLQRTAAGGGEHGTAAAITVAVVVRSEERRVGKECVSTFRSGVAPYL